MSDGKSKQEFLDFLDWLGNKGLLPLNTAQARKAVANKVLAALEESELVDVTTLDVENVMLRFSNKFGKRYTPESMRTYRSRFETSISDFKSYCADPVGFRPSGRTPNRRKVAESDDTQNVIGSKLKPTLGKNNKPSVPAPVISETHSILGNVVPIQIRHDLTVRIGPVPYDLTLAEARKIANIIIAHAAPES